MVDWLVALVLYAVLFAAAAAASSCGLPYVEVDNPPHTHPASKVVHVVWPAVLCMTVLRCSGRFHLIGVF